MIEVKCTGSSVMRLQDMNPMQGALKHRTQDDIEDIKQSLTEKGLLMPFVIWQANILDGHGRHAALMQMSQAQPDILSAEWPVVDVQADTLEEAKSALLEINARYGKITPRGLEAFVAGMPSIKVPIAIGVKVPVVTASVIREPVQHRTTTVVKLRIEKDKAAEFSKIISELPYVELL